MKKLCCLAALVLTLLTMSIFSINVNDCFYAIKNNDVDFFKKNDDAIKKILEEEKKYGGQYIVQNGKFFSFLTYAMYNCGKEDSIKKKEIITYLIDAGIDLTNWLNRGALFYAVLNRLDEIIKKLLEKSMNPFMPDTNFVTSAFALTINADNLGYVKLFVEADKKNNYIRYYDPSYSSYIQKSPYLYAKFLERKKIAEYLIEMGEDKKSVFYNSVALFLRQ